MSNMGIFSESPKSFEMDRKSPLASRLKSLVSKKLGQFLGNYTDDVLAEYIVVLVCNGKHQIQARDDLEAFLGERSGEFVSWLWDHLLKYTHQSNPATGVLDPKDVTVTSPINGGADSYLRSERSKDIQNFGNVDNPLDTNGKYCHPSAHTTSPLSSNNLELSEGIQYCKGSVVPLDAVVTNKVQSQIQRSTIPREIGATETCRDDSLTQKPSRIGGYSLIPTGRDQSLQCMDKSNKIVDHKGSPSRAVGERSCQSKKSRGSVWDRLGKPSREKCFINDKTVDAHAIDVVEKDQEIYDKHTLSVAVHNEEHCRSMKNEVQELDKSNRKLDQGISAICKLHATNNIRRKRHFGEISSSPGSCSVSLLGTSNMDRQHNESSRDIERPNSTSEAAGPALTSQVQDVKQRLRQIEMEISKLRTKQLEIKRDGKPPVLSNSGFVKQSREDEESRTVFVSNVHFAATEEALSLHFAKCGLVLNVVILIDKLNAQSKGSAYIKFSHKESVDKAVALSGTSFFSRTLKVVRKTEEATVAASIPPLQTGKPSQAQFSQIKRETVFERPLYPGSHLQWRREPVSAPSEPSALITKEKGVSSAASSQQQLSSSHASLKIKKTVSSSTETPAGANLPQNSGCC